MASSRHPGLARLTFAAIWPVGRARPGGLARRAWPAAPLPAASGGWCG